MTDPHPNVIQGKVAVYRLDHARILQDTRPDWPRIGPDLVARLDGMPTPPEAPDMPSTNIPPFPQPSDDGLWTRAKGPLRDEHPSGFAARIAALHLEGVVGDEACLNAASGFHAAHERTHFAGVILYALQRSGAEVRSVRIT